MSQTSLQADEIAAFLEQNPQFFLENEYLLSHLKLPHPRSDKVISLSERQTMHLRRQNQQLEKQVAQFLHNARENELISRALMNWACDLLGFKGGPESVCEFMCQRLKKQYGLQEVQLRLWWPDQPFEAATGKISTQHWVQKLNSPYTGPTTELEVATWFEQSMSSMAVIPLYTRDANQCVGALALGSDIAKRFTYNIGTDFLVAMGQIFMAMLARFYAENA